MGLWQNIRGIFGQSEKAFARGDDEYSDGLLVAPGFSRIMAANIPTLFRCVSLISTQVASLPIRFVDATGTPIAPAALPADAVQLQALLQHRPDGVRYKTLWLTQLVVDLLTTGNAFVWIDGRGTTRTLRLLSPSQVLIYRFASTGEIYYYDTSPQPTNVRSFSEICHVALPNLGTREAEHLAGGEIGSALRGYPPLATLSETVRTEYSVGRWVRNFFLRGLNTDMAISFPENLTTEQVDELQAWIKRRNRSSEQSRAPLILRHGAKVEKLSLSPQDSELLGSRRFSIEEIARVYGVPSVMLNLDQKSTTAASTESLTRRFVQYTLAPIAHTIENALSAALLPMGVSINFNLRDLIRADAKEAAAYYTAALGGSAGGGWMTPNEVRQREGLPSAPDGDNLTQWPPPALQETAND